MLTEPPGAELRLYRFQARDRMLLPVAAGSLGKTPIHAREIPHGSYRLELRLPGHLPVVVPVEVGRQAHWDGVPPGERAPAPIRLPRVGELDDDEILVPAGWCWVGGDPYAFGPLPARLLWVDAFVIGRFPVTIPGRTGVVCGQSRRCSQTSKWSARPPHRRRPRLRRA